MTTNSQSTVVLDCKENTKLNYTKYYKSSKPESKPIHYTHM